MLNYMNIPEYIEVLPSDIVREYRHCEDVKQVAAIYCMTTKEVNAILRQAGVKKVKKKKIKESKLDEIGMSESDFI